MESEKEISTRIVYRKEMFYKSIGCLLVGVLLLLVSLYWIKSAFLNYLSLAFMFFPLFVVWFRTKCFTHAVLIHVGNDHITVRIGQTRKKQVLTEIPLNQLRSYSIQVPTDRFLSIKFNLIGGKSYEFSFFKKRSEEDTVSAEALIEIFHGLIKDFNGRSAINQIPLLPSFYARRTGLVMIIGLLILLAVALFLALILEKKAIPAPLIFGVALIAQLVIKRKTDLEYFKKMQ